MRSRLLLVAAIAAGFGSLSAQDLSRWENLNVLSPGQSVKVVMADLKSYEGKCAQVTADGITLRMDKGFSRSSEMTLPRSSVVRVSRTAHRGRNALIGLGMGAAAGLGTAAWGFSAMDKGYGDAMTKGQYAAVMITTFGAVGAGVGYAIPSFQTLYRRAPSEVIE